MKFGAAIIDSRQVSNEVFERHLKFLPESTRAFHGALYFHESIAGYNKTLTDIRFWESLPFDKVLIFQQDSGLLREGIEEFYEYDFVGAPLYHIPFPCMNGGLSIRDRQAMISCIKDTPYNPNIHGNEDIYFCKQLQKIGGKLPTKEKARLFSVETIYGLGSLGYHAIEKWHTPEKCETILNQYKK